MIDTDVVSELRKGARADTGVRTFIQQADMGQVPLFLSVVTIGELRRGVELIRHRGDLQQAQQLESWLLKILQDFQDCILPFDEDCAQLWGRLRVPHPENALDKQIAATALIHGLTLASRNERHFQASGLAVLNPFGS
ncbi:MAG: type II toxin-antitoxin system VapC family toxin [Nevskia sp.]|nr:type II toxin-antitoxin system VapC family toxin [Nevskia sp.]